ncbi:MAG: peroxiredoxin [Caulobacteraceae bacterium]
MFRPMIATAAACVLTALPAAAALQPGATAPEFTAVGSMAGKAFTFDLAETLKKGPVVLYFFPKAFTGGCDAQAHMFSEAVGDYAALHATVIGVSRDGIEALNQFSVQKCSGKFAVLSDQDGRITKAYDAVLKAKPEYAGRTSYVIAPTGKVIYEYTDLNPEKHVDNTLAALKAWAGGKSS